MDPRQHGDLDDDAHLNLDVDLDESLDAGLNASSDLDDVIELGLKGPALLDEAKRRKRVMPNRTGCRRKLHNAGSIIK